MKRLISNLLAIGILLSMTLSSVRAMEALEPVKTPEEEPKQDEITIYLTDATMNIKRDQLKQLADLSQTIKNSLEDLETPINQLDEFLLSAISQQTFANLLKILPQLIQLKQAQNEREREESKNQLVNFIKQSMSANEIIELIRAANFLEIALLIDNGLAFLAYPKDVKNKKDYDSYIKQVNDERAIPQSLWNSILQKVDLYFKLLGYVLEKKLYSQSSLKGTRPINSVAISPDGNFIVTGSGDDTAIIWDKKTGKELQTLDGHTGPIISVAISPDGNFIVTGSYDNTAIIWDKKTGKELQTLDGHTGPITSVAISPDGNFIVTGSYDDTAIIWDSKTGEKLHKLEGHTDSITSVSITSVAISPDGNFIVTGSYDDTAIIWDKKTGKELQTLDGHTSAIKSVVISPDGNFIVTGSWDKTAIIWQLIDPRLNFATLPRDQVILIYYLLELYFSNKPLSIPTFMQGTYNALPDYLKNIFPF